MKTKLFVSSLLVMVLTRSYKKDDNMQPAPKDPDTAGDMSVDRFGSSFADLFLRNAQNGFPEANTVRSYDEIVMQGHALAPKTTIENCPIVLIQQ